MMAANDTYITCSTAGPDILDIYTNNTLVGKVISDTDPGGSGGIEWTYWNHYIPANLDPIFFYWANWSDIAMGKSAGIPPIYVTPAIMCVNGGRIYRRTAPAYTYETRPAGDTDQGWNSVACDYDGSHYLVGSEPSFNGSGRLYRSTDSGASWAEQQPAGDNDFYWTCVSDSDGSNLMAGAFGGRLWLYSGGTWTETKPAGDVNKDWMLLATDGDGSHLLAGVMYGRLYRSTDGGANWVEQTPAGDASVEWRVGTSNSDGSVLLAAPCSYASYSYVYRYKDGAWTTMTDMGYVPWYGADSSLDGSHLLVAAMTYGGEEIYFSSDSGDSWEEIGPVISMGPGYEFTGSYKRVALDGDGTNLLLCEYAGYVWYALSEEDPPTTFYPNDTYLTCSSADPDLLDFHVDDILVGRVTSEKVSILSWTKTTSGLPSGTLSWRSVASDADGSNLIGCVYGGRVWMSTNSGTSWTETRPTTVDEDRNWYCVASDDDGSNLIIGDYTGRLWVSTNSGTSWTAANPNGDADGNWVSVASDSDGSNLIAAHVDARLWIYSGGTWSETRPTGVDENKSWYVVASDADGSNLLAAIYGGHLYRYSGGTWVEQVIVPWSENAWYTCCSNSDGSILLAGVATISGPSKLYRYSDGSWDIGYPPDPSVALWVSSASDSDGSNFIATMGYYPAVYISTDYGVSWGSTSSGDDDWQGGGGGVASNSDGSRLLLGDFMGYLWIGTTALAYSANDTYLKCSSDLLDVYVDGTIVGRFSDT